MFPTKKDERKYLLENTPGKAVHGQHFFVDDFFMTRFRVIDWNQRHLVEPNNAAELCQRFQQR